jgi:hypothetical protein
VRRRLTGSIFAACVTATTVASAALPPSDARPRDGAGAEALFREGRAGMEAGDYAHACPKFAESLRLDFAIGTVLNLAACEEKVGRLASAWQHYRQVVEMLPPEDERHPLAAARADALDARVPRLTISMVAPAPQGTRVTRDDVDLGDPSLGVALPVDPGEHVVMVIAPGRADRRWVVQIRESERRQLTIEPGAVRDAAVVRTTSAHDARRPAGFVVGGLGVASLAVGSYFGVRALNSRSDSDAGCTNGRCRDAASANAYDDAKSFAHVADATLAIGIVGVAVGSYLVLTSSTTTETAAPTVARAGLRATPSGVGLSW